MTDVRIGDLLDATAQRDAIHIAIAPMVARETLWPGTRVSLLPDGGIAKTGGPVANLAASSVAIGVVDPFLPGGVARGERVYVFLFPNTITSLRHEWTHPAFPEFEEVMRVAQPVRSASEQWLRDLAETLGITYSRLMSGAAAAIASREAGHGTEWLTGGAAMEGEKTPEEFWGHYEAVTKMPVASDYRGNFFTCSC